MRHKVKKFRTGTKTLAAFGPIVLASILSVSSPAFAQDQSTPPAATAPDDTAKNKNHRTTADQQTNAAGDRDLTAQIRKSIIADKTLSTYAHNIKIITINGQVTLKGPVNSDAEKQTIADLAAKAAGADKVTNKITVKQ
jgi:hyperosmotically inducible periplasmic protein